MTEGGDPTPVPNAREKRGWNRTRAKKQRKAEQSEADQKLAAERLERELAAARRVLLGEYGVDKSGIVCSFPWADVAIAALKKAKGSVSQKVGKLYRDLFALGIYPPGGKDSLMRSCPECGRDCPPSVREAVDLPGRTNGRCVDCLEEMRAWGSSEFRVQSSGVRVQESPALVRRVRLQRKAGVAGEYEIVRETAIGGKWDDDAPWIEDEPIEETPVEDPSRSAVAIRAMEERGAKLKAAALPSEKTGDLKRLIAKNARAPKPPGRG
jgi:hypothetical protein